VEHEPITAGDASAAGNDGIVLKDSDGAVIGRFFHAEIVGYFVHEASGAVGLPLSR